MTQMNVSMKQTHRHRLVVAEGRTGSGVWD